MLFIVGVNKKNFGSPKLVLELIITSDNMPTVNKIIFRSTPKSRENMPH